MSKPGYIYYIVCTETFRCKIGFTRGNPYDRMKNLQTGSPTQLTLLAVHSGSKEDEADLHKKFAANRVRGEWFTPSEELYTHCSMIVWLTAAHTLRTKEPLPDWVLVGLQSMHENNPLPDDMAALLQ